MSSGRVYLDHAATTPVLPEVIDVVATRMRALGNPSSLHGSGREARKAVEEARESVAATLGAAPGDVVFTSGGTEADNLAVKGLYWARRAADPRRTRVLVSAVEHHAVSDTAEWLEKSEGAQVERLPVDADGRLVIEELRAALARDPESVALVSVMWANNEVGTLQPIGVVVAAASRYGVPVHSDAVQAVGSVAVDFSASRLTAMTVSGHKLGGPVGSGALLVRRDADLVPVLHGGGQEREIRSGTLDAPSIDGFATAVAAAVSRRAERAAHLGELREKLVRGVLDAVPDAIINGPADPSRRLPGIAHVSFPGCEGDAMMMLLDAQAIDCSTGAACAAGVPEPSHVLLAMGADPLLARSSLRFSLGHSSSRADVDALVTAIGPVAERARAAGYMNVKG
ncbi:MAG TPA: cysteine desulfurase family protein [Jiangellaceae bacterium]